MSVDIRRGSDRFVDRAQGRRTLHALSFGEHYDPDHVSFGPMVCHDDHLLAEGQGFDDHSHSDLVIVSYVVSGAVRHTDTTGTTGASTLLSPGEIGVLRTGANVVHSEVAAAPQTRFVQVWLTDPGPGGEASYEVVTTPPVTPIPGATFTALRLEAGETFTTPLARLVHVYVARGALLRSSLAEPLHDGDAFLFTDEPSHELTSGAETDLLVWSFA
jgi:redox-sensitive bicupin YhaK (pirin superfamily)